MAHYDCDYCGETFCDDCDWAKLEQEFINAKKEASNMVEDKYMATVRPVIQEAQSAVVKYISIFKIYGLKLKRNVDLNSEKMYYGGLRIYGIIKNKDVWIHEFRENVDK